MLAQMLATFTAGLFYGFVRLKINSIVPLMLFHWLWDFVLIGGLVMNDNGINGGFATAMVLFEMAFAVTVVPYCLYREGKAQKQSA